MFIFTTFCLRFMKNNFHFLQLSFVDNSRVLALELKRGHTNFHFFQLSFVDNSRVLALEMNWGRTNLHFFQLIFVDNSRIPVLMMKRKHTKGDSEATVDKKRYDATEQTQNHPKLVGLWRIFVLRFWFKHPLHK